MSEPDFDELPYRVHLAWQPTLSQTCLYYAETRGIPLKHLSDDRRKLEAMLEIGTVSGRGIGPDPLAGPKRTLNVPGDRTADLWDVVDPKGNPYILVFVEGERFARLVEDAAVIPGLLEEAEQALANARRADETKAFSIADKSRQMAVAAQAKVDLRAKTAFMLASDPVLRAKVDAIFASGRRPAWRPEIVKGVQNGSQSGLSVDPWMCLSGYSVHPWIPQGESWPLVDGEPMDFVLQLEIASMPEQARRLIGEDGLLQFFYAPDSWDDEHPQDSVLLRRVYPGKGHGAAMANPSGVNVAPVAITGWKEIADSSIERLSDQADAAVHALNKNYSIKIELVEPVSRAGDKLMGGPTFAQETDWPKCRGRRMEMLFQFDTLFGDSEDHHSFGDCSPAESLYGTGHIFVDKKHPDNMVYIWNCD